MVDLTGDANVQPCYANVVRHLRDASIPLRQLAGDGNAAITLAAARLVALAFSPRGENLLWSHPQLADTDLVRTHPERLFGGFGGDRLWFAPELAFNWDGVPNWQTFENYKPPAAMDPGHYEFAKTNGHSVMLRGRGKLPVHGTDRHVGFEVDRTIRLAASPLPRNDPLMSQLDYVGIEFSHVLKVADDTRAGVMDPWHLLQVPVGSILVVPFKQHVDANLSRPLSYALSGGWVQKPDHIRWRYEGEARAKFGLPASVLTGRSAVLRELAGGRWCMILREFPVDLGARYADHPYGEPRADQVFHAWDGFGFGEMEFHSPLVDALKGPRVRKQTDRLWAFGGAAANIQALASRLLGLDVGDLLVAP